MATRVSMNKLGLAPASRLRVSPPKRVTHLIKTRYLINYESPQIPHIYSPLPTPLYSVGHVYPPFFWSFNFVLGGGGGNFHIFQRIAQRFKTSGEKQRKFIALHQYLWTFVHNCSKNQIVKVMSMHFVPGEPKNKPCSSTANLF